MTSPQTLRTIRQAIDIRHILRAKWETRGKVAKCLCQWHNEKTPSFRANLPGHPHAGRFKCHGCGKSGDVFDILVQLDQITMHEAISRLAAIAGVELEGYAPETVAERRARLLAAEERDVAEWWFRSRYRMFRSWLNMPDDGPPEIGANLEPVDPRQALAVRMMAWIREHHADEEGLKAFRAVGGIGAHLRKYREWQRVQKLRDADKAAVHEGRLDYLREYVHPKNRTVADIFKAKYGCNMDPGNWCRFMPVSYIHAINGAPEIF